MGRAELTCLLRSPGGTASSHLWGCLSVTPPPAQQPSFLCCLHGPLAWLESQVKSEATGTILIQVRLKSSWGAGALQPGQRTGPGGGGVGCGVCVTGGEGVALQPGGEEGPGVAPWPVTKQRNWKRPEGHSSPGGWASRQPGAASSTGGAPGGSTGRPLHPMP